MTHAIRPEPSSARDRLVDLLDYVEQVVRLDERIAFDIADYRLPDGRPVSLRLADTAALPGVRHDLSDDAGPVWLAVDRLARRDPPAPPDDLAPWLTLVPDPARPPELRRERIVEMDEAGRLARVAAGACATSFVRVEPDAPAPPDAESAPPRYRQTLCLADQPGTEVRLQRWIGEVWAPWAEAERPRRRTIRLYETLYRLLQLLETGGTEAPVEVVWGIGVARWQHAGRRLDRPFIERGVDIELDDALGGLLRVRPTVADATVDLKPYEELGCPGLAPLDETIRREVEAAAAEDGVTPFRRASFEPILVAAAARLDPDAVYLPAADGAEPLPPGTLVIDDGWVLFARPRSAHVLLADLDRLKAVARDPERSIEGLPTRLVTEPSAATGTDWEPLGDTLGGLEAMPASDEPESLDTEVFFPKPFNDDQVAIVRRLARSDGLVVQGPPGTGKTHTIANLICHAMATGQRVLVVSRGEAALAVLRDQLPEKVRPLAIALLSSERQGLGQVEAAIRQIQAIVEESRPEIRRSAIRRCEAEIVKLRTRMAALDAELDTLAGAQAARVGPRAETPAELARRIAGSRPAFAWFADRPAAYRAEGPLTDAMLAGLAAARARVGDLIDHRGAVLPSPADLPDAATVADWHAMILRSLDAGDAAIGPLAPGEAGAAAQLAAAFDGLAGVREALASHAPLHPLLAGAPGRWGEVLAGLAAEWRALDAARIEHVRHAVDLPPALIDDGEARAAIGRGARGERLWPLLSLGKGAAKAHLAAVRLRGAPVREGDAPGWAAVEARLATADAERDLSARWRALGAELGLTAPAPPEALGLVAAALDHGASARAALAGAPGLRARLPALDTLATDPAALRERAAGLRQAGEQARLLGAREAVARLRLLFEAGETRTAAMARRIVDDVLGRPEIEAPRVAAAWEGLCTVLGRLHAAAPDFDTITATTAAIAEAGAPDWAGRLRREPAEGQGPGQADPLLPSHWAEVWDLAAAEAHLTRLDTRARLTSLVAQRGEHERNVARLFLDLVRERTFYALERRLSPSVKSALVEFVRALGRLGKGTGRGAARQRRAAREAMRRCYAAVPCWIMPTWRASEQLPPDLAAFDLVILDEASQSDVTELPAVLRGRKILVVGDDRQVSPVAPFVAQGRIESLRRRYLRGLPFQSLLEPGESLYTLMQAVFPDERLMLREHFRCVEPIVRFSMQFYPETLIPLRIPAAADRLDPPLVDILVPHGEREKGRKINRAEAEVAVEEIARMAADPAFARRSIGVISLIGGDQAELIRTMLEERLGAEAMQRHAILCGDSATFQGNERDVMVLSMVADRHRRTTLTMQRYEQRFNVAMSRARDRVVLVRSVERADLNPADLKARLIAHFDQPMPSAAARDGDPLERCESDFERDVMARLLALGYGVTPQVGALGFRIDLVVEGEGGRRLAVECDGDRFHGPGQWREDMRRQRVLERVGWRFWRCFASSFYADPDGTVADLVETLARAGIVPEPGGEAPRRPSPFVEHRVAKAPPAPAAQGELALGGHATRAAAGDRLRLIFADDRRTLSVVLDDGPEDVARGLVSVTSPLGLALLGHEEEEEVVLPFETGARRVLIDRIERTVFSP